MKVGILTDMHLGVRQYGLQEREEDFYSQFELAIDVFLKKNVDVVIIGGDVFDQPRPSPKALKVFSNGLKKLFEKDIFVCNIVGNHAMIQSNDFVTADFFFLELPGFDNYMLLNEDCYFQNDDLLICGLPYHYNFYLDNFKEKVDNLNTFASSCNSKTKILVLHQAFQEFCGFAGEDLSINDININSFDLIVCGHIHSRKIYELEKDGTVFLQPGSIERLSVAEARDEENQGKGVFVLDTKKMVDVMSISDSFIRLKNPRSFLISDMYMDSTEDLLKIKKEIQDYVLKCEVPPVLFLTIHDSSNSYQQLIDLTRNLKDDCLTVKFNYFDESIEFDEDIILEDAIPSAREALKISLNPMDDDQAKLAIDLYDLLKDGKDAHKLLNDYFVKNMKTK